MKAVAATIAAAALAFPGVALAGFHDGHGVPPPSMTQGGGGGSYPLLGSACTGWAIGYCVAGGKIIPCRCAKVLSCGVFVWMWVDASIPPAKVAL